MRTTLLFALLLFACNYPEQQAMDHDTETFRYFLREAFGDSIPEEKRTFILLSETGCKGCRDGGLVRLHEEVLNTRPAGVIYILSPLVDVHDSLMRPCEILRDSSGLIDNVNLPLSNITFVKTEHGKVSSISSMRAETMDSIGYFLRKE